MRASKAAKLWQRGSAAPADRDDADPLFKDHRQLEERGESSVSSPTSATSRLLPIRRKSEPRPTRSVFVLLGLGSRRDRRCWSCFNSAWRKGRFQERPTLRLVDERTQGRSRMSNGNVETGTAAGTGARKRPWIKDEVSARSRGWEEFLSQPLAARQGRPLAPTA